MITRESRLRQRIDVLTDQRDGARAQVAELRREVRRLRARITALEGQRTFWKKRYDDERWASKQ